MRTAIAIVFVMAGLARAQESVGDLRPRPDPTLLTTEQLLREIASLKELLRSEIAGNHSLYQEKFLERDEAVKAALQSAKELVAQQNESNAASIAKSEEVFAKQIEAAQRRIDELRDAVTRIEARREGVGDSWGVILGVLGAGGLVAGLLIALLTLFLRAGYGKTV